MSHGMSHGRLRCGLLVVRHGQRGGRFGMFQRLWSNQDLSHATLNDRDRNAQPAAGDGSPPRARGPSTLPQSVLQHADYAAELSAGHGPDAILAGSHVTVAKPVTPEIRQAAAPTIDDGGWRSARPR